MARVFETIANSNSGCGQTDRTLTAFPVGGSIALADSRKISCEAPILLANWESHSRDATKSALVAFNDACVGLTTGDTGIRGSWQRFRTLPLEGFQPLEQF